MDSIFSIRKQLQAMADPKLAESGKRYFKEPVKMYGTKTVEVVALAKNSFKELNGQSKDEIFSLCEILFKSGYMEESFIACEWSYLLHKSYISSDIAVFESWISKYVSNWATCDTLCNHSVGTLIEMYPTTIKMLLLWARSKNVWMRRASAVSLIIPARKGLFLKEIFQIANTLLLAPEDLVQKGYGWMLKAASQAHQKEVFDFVMKQKQIMPRTALRYAIEKMPKERKAEAMKK